ncbi:MAG: hypothetical protein ACFCU4_11720 [Puniceicoccaceae bacterium]
MSPHLLGQSEVRKVVFGWIPFWLASVPLAGSAVGAAVNSRLGKKVSS